jgi:hypothetical protein
MDKYGAMQEKTDMFTEQVAPVLSLYSTEAKLGLNSSLHGETPEVNA